MALENLEFKIPKLVSFGRGGNRKRERGESKRGRREEEEGEPSQKRYGTLDFWYGNSP